MTDGELVYKSNDGKALTTSLKIAEVFGKRNADVLRDIRNLHCSPEFRERNFALMVNINKLPQGGAQKSEYYQMTKDGFTILVMGYTGSKAMAFKEKYIEAFNRMESTIKNGGFSLPQTFAQALMLAAKQQEKIEEQNRLLVEQEPKVQFFDAVASSKDAIEMKSVANTLDFVGVGRNKLFEILRDAEVLTHKNQPMQRFIDNGYFRTIEQKYEKSDGEICINIKTLVYQKGVNYIKSLLEKLGYKQR